MKTISRDMHVHVFGRLWSDWLYALGFCQQLILI